MATQITPSGLRSRTMPGLHRAGARYLRGVVWLTQDPLGLGPDTNPYRYAENDPMNRVDPSGLWAGPPPPMPIPWSGLQGRPVLVPLEIPKTADDAVKEVMESHQRILDGKPTFKKADRRWGALMMCMDWRLHQPGRPLFDVGGLDKGDNAGPILSGVPGASFLLGEAKKGPIKVIVILGHTDCGAIGLAVDPVAAKKMDVDDFPETKEDLAKVKPYVKNPEELKGSWDNRLKQGAENNARHQASMLLKNPVIVERIRKGELAIIIGVIDTKADPQKITWAEFKEGRKPE